MYRDENVDTERQQLHVSLAHSSQSPPNYYQYYDYYYEAAPVVAAPFAVGANGDAGGAPYHAAAYAVDERSAAGYAVEDDAYNNDAALSSPDYSHYYDPCLYDEWAGACEPGEYEVPHDPWHIAIWSCCGVGILLNLLTIFVFLQQGRVTGESAMVVDVYRLRSLESIRPSVCPSVSDDFSLRGPSYYPPGLVVVAVTHWTMDTLTKLSNFEQY